MREQRESKYLLETLDSLVKEQEQTIKVLHSNLHDYAAEIVRLRSGAKGALSALRTGHDIDVVAAIQILRGLG